MTYQPLIQPDSINVIPSPATAERLLDAARDNAAQVRAGARLRTGDSVYPIHLHRRLGAAAPFWRIATTVDRFAASRVPSASTLGRSLGLPR